MELLSPSCMQLCLQALERLTDHVSFCKLGFLFSQLLRFLHSTVVCLLWQFSLTLLLLFRETVGQQQLARVVCGSQRRRMLLFEEICNYCADIAIIAVLVTTFANTRKNRTEKKKVTTKQPNKKASQKQTEKSKKWQQP